MLPLILPHTLYCRACVSDEVIRVRVNYYEPSSSFAVVPFEYLGIDSFISETIVTNDHLIGFPDC